MKPILIAAAAVLVAASASAATYRLGAIEVGQAWSRPAVSGTNGIGSMTVRADGDVKAGHGDTIYLTPQDGRIHRFGTDGKAMA